MTKVISAMPANVQKRFKVLHMLSDERSKINDKFEEEVNALREKIMAQKQPKHDERDRILAGAITEFDEYMAPYEERDGKISEAMKKINSKKSAEEIAEDVEEMKEHVPVDVTHLIG